MNWLSPRWMAVVVSIFANSLWHVEHVAVRRGFSQDGLLYCNIHRNFYCVFWRCLLLSLFLCWTKLTAWSLLMKCWFSLLSSACLLLCIAKCQVYFCVELIRKASPCIPATILSLRSSSFTRPYSHSSAKFSNSCIKTSIASSSLSCWTLCVQQ